MPPPDLLVMIGDIIIVLFDSAKKIAQLLLTNPEFAAEIEA